MNMEALISLPEKEAIVARYRDVLEHIRRASGDAERQANSVQLVCVSKNFSSEAIESVLQVGQRIFGENRVQEAKAKWLELRPRYNDIELHLIGPLQTNKAADAVRLFDVIETVDRMHLAEILAKEIQAQRRHPRLLVQVNIGEEPQKAGVAPQETDLFVRQCRKQWGLNIDGLMCIPPAGMPVSPYFALLRILAERNDLKHLSMGMSADYALAIQMGATHVRIGSAIFGERYLER